MRRMVVRKNMVPRGIVGGPSTEVSFLVTELGEYLDITPGAPQDGGLRVS